MNKVCINPLVERKIAAGIQLLDEKDFDGTIWDNQLVQLVNSSHQLIGTAYLSKQHKGVGWYLGRSVKKLSVSYFVTLFKTAKKKREHFAASEWTNAYRLFNQDGDDFGGLTIDLYKDFALFSWYNVFVYQEKELIIQAFQEVFPEVRGAYEKIRFKGPDKETAHLYGASAPDTFTILENGVAYQVFLNDGLMTGIFLDQHEVRRGLVEGLALGKSVLNLFSYTAAFSVAAAMGGAVETISVDLVSAPESYQRLILFKISWTYPVISLWLWTFLIILSMLSESSFLLILLLLIHQALPETKSRRFQ